MTADDTEIRALLKAREEAIRAHDARAVISMTAPNLVTFDLQPPLAFCNAAARQASDLDAWFVTWNGPVRSVLADPEIVTSGNLAVAFGFTHLQGLSKDGEPHDSWFRSTFVLSKQAEGWRIVHDHHSYPMYMDGSQRAAVDLTPDFT